ncbi:hypothetical protein [Actinobaculum suis]|uniref:Uncharacterized protein n=1 Tax=Actinobaculum suis TaxID=1657 RepID=A0AAW9HGX7_9ACTO|nr:hypothetical protein [Actinobaculum suis]MDY5153198.1 hypothetical protein [Actinobaculum suis]
MTDTRITGEIAFYSCLYFYFNSGPARGSDGVTGKNVNKSYGEAPV